MSGVSIANFVLVQRCKNTSVLDNAAAWFNFSEIE
jgi:hypothetical protein